MERGDRPSGSTAFCCTWPRPTCGGFCGFSRRVVALASHRIMRNSRVLAACRGSGGVASRRVGAVQGEGEAVPTEPTELEEPRIALLETEEAKWGSTRGVGGGAGCGSGAGLSKAGPCAMPPTALAHTSVGRGRRLAAFWDRVRLSVGESPRNDR